MHNKKALTLNQTGITISIETIENKIEIVLKIQLTALKTTSKIPAFYSCFVNFFFHFWLSVCCSFLALRTSNVNAQAANMH